MKNIMIELWFEDEFVPPDYFEGSSKKKCEGCPFLRWDDNYEPDCGLLGPCEPGPCPIKKYFLEEE